MQIETFADQTLILGDCREVVHQLNVKLSTVITDPPYGINAYDGDPFAAWHLYPNVLHSVRSIMLPGAALVIYGRWPTYARWQIASEDAGFVQRAEVVRYMGKIVYVQKSGLAQQHELVYFGYLPPCKLSTWNANENRDPYSNERYKQGVGLERKSDILSKRHGRTDDEAKSTFTPHPRGAWPRSVRKCRRHLGKERLQDGQKPIEDVEWALRMTSRSGDIILDPFVGSGTTLVACHSLGMRGIGIERDLAHFDAACRRLAAETAPPLAPTLSY